MRPPDKLQKNALPLGMHAGTCVVMCMHTPVHLPPLPSGCDCPSCGAVGSP